MRTPMVESSFVKSPCTDRCQLDQESLLCTGCWRSLTEILGWRDMNDERRRSTILAAESRRPVSVES